MYKVDTNNPWFPYTKVQEGNIDLRNLPVIPRQICDYLLDMPNGNVGYVPKDDNTYPRARFWKYLFYDIAHPLEQVLPTVAEKKSVLFDPDRPTDPSTDKGYRLIPQIYVAQAQTGAQTRVHVYLGRMVPINAYKVAYSIVFDIFSHYTYENNSKEEAMSRTVNIEAAIFEALSGVNMNGIGTFFCDKKGHPDCGSQVMQDDANVIRRLIMAFEVATVDEAKPLAEARIQAVNGGYFC